MRRILPNIFTRNLLSYSEGVIKSFKKEKSLENFLKRLRKSCSGNFEKILNSNIQREILKNKICKKRNV